MPLVVYGKRVNLWFTHIYFPASGQAVVTGVAPSPPSSLPSIFIAHGVQQSQCSSIFHLVLLTHSRSRAFRKSNGAQEKSPRIILTPKGDMASVYLNGLGLSLGAKLVYQRAFNPFNNIQAFSKRGRKKSYSAFRKLRRICTNRLEVLQGISVGFMAQINEDRTCLCSTISRI